MSYKLLAIDLDGTLLRNDGTIHPEDASAIERLRAAGIPVTIVTGRSYLRTRPIARALGLAGAIACADGGHIVDVDDDRELLCCAITSDDALRLREVLDRHRTTSFRFAPDALATGASGVLAGERPRPGSPSDDASDTTADRFFHEREQDLMPTLAVGAEIDVRAAAAELEQRFAHAVTATVIPVPRAQTFAVVVRPVRATKGAAVAWLASHHGCATAEVVAVGDWFNDVSMFQVVGRSFAMGHSPVAVKAQASDALIADARRGGAIAEAIRRAWAM